MRPTELGHGRPPPALPPPLPPPPPRPACIWRCCWTPCRALPRDEKAARRDCERSSVAAGCRPVCRHLPAVSWLPGLPTTSAAAPSPAAAAASFFPRQISCAQLTLDHPLHSQRAALLSPCTSPCPCRRQFLVDLAEAQRRGCCYDGRQQSWDFMTLPGGGQWLSQVQLLATDLQAVLLYDQHLELLGALSFADRPVRTLPAGRWSGVGVVMRRGERLCSVLRGAGQSMHDTAFCLLTCRMPHFHPHPMQAGASAAAGRRAGPPQPRMFFGLLSMLLFKCPLRQGLLTLEPPLLLGAADYLLHQQQRQREELATAAAGAQWRQQLGVDDDVHLLRVSLLRLRLLQQAALVGGSLAGTLDDAFVRQASKPASCGAEGAGGWAVGSGCLTAWPHMPCRLLLAPYTHLGGGAASAEASACAEAVAHSYACLQAATHGQLSLRFLDVNCNQGLSDASLAQLLALCPQLRVLQAAGSNAGAAVLAVLAGRQQSAAEPEQRKHQSRRQSNENTADTVILASEEFNQLDLSDGPSQQPAAGQQAAAPLPSAPACPLLEQLDLSGCCAIKGSALRRAVRCLPRLLDLRLNECSALHALLDLLPATGAAAGKAGRAGKSSGKVAAVQTALAKLTRLEALNADNLSGQHAASLLQQCTSLRQLALSGKQLAAEQFDRQQHGQAGSGDDGSGGSDGDSGTLTSLLHLEVGWGTGGTLLQHPLRPHLVSLTAHVGAAVSDWDLRQLAASCRFLARLSLRGTNVSDAGGAACCCVALFCACPIAACCCLPRDFTHLPAVLTCRCGGGAAALLAADLPAAAGLHWPLHRPTGSTSSGSSSSYASLSGTGQQQQQQGPGLPAPRAPDQLGGSAAHRCRPGSAAAPRRGGAALPGAQRLQQADRCRVGSSGAAGREPAVRAPGELRRAAGAAQGRGGAGDGGSGCSRQRMQHG